MFWVKAGSFYTRVFGWDFSPFQGPEDFWPITQDLLAEWEAAARPGIPTREAAPTPITGPQAIVVVSLEEAGLRVMAEGGRVLTAPMPVSGGFLVYCQDAAGHPFAMLELVDLGDRDGEDIDPENG